MADKFEKGVAVNGRSSHEERGLKLQARVLPPHQACRSSHEERGLK